MNREISLTIAFVLAITSSAFLKVGAVESGTGSAGTRTINFPIVGGAPIGQYTIDDDVLFMDQWLIPKKPVLARGPARVPVNAHVTLATGFQTESGLQFLKPLRPGDLFGLDLMGSAVTHDNLKYVLALKGLKRLVISGFRFDDSDITRIVNELPTIEELYMIDVMPGMTDHTLQTIASLKNLRVLQIANNDKLTDSGIARLAASKSLTSLYLGRNKNITDAALSSVNRIQSLKTLDLMGTKITDNGLRHLLSMPSLRRLDLTNTAVDDKSMQIIGQLSQLECLNLSRTKVTDKGIASLDKLTNLRKLWLRGLSKVTDASVSHLASHKKLENLELEKTGITKSGIQSLGRLLPKSEVHGKPPCRCHKRERVNWEGQKK